VRHLYSLKLITLFLAILFSTAMVLGGFSIRPFTKLYLPWMYFSQWYRLNYPNETDEVCLSKLRNEGAQFSLATFPPSDLEKGCIIDTTVVVSNLRIKLTNIAYPPQADFVAMSCDLSLKLSKFIDQVFIPLTEKFFNQKPIAFLHKGGYACRGQRIFNSIKSEHAFGTAIDFAGLILEDGQQFLIEKNYNDNSNASQFFAELASLACNFFGTNLGPAFDALHHDHLHWAMGFPRVCK
jgi:hypothetical protein